MSSSYAGSGSYNTNTTIPDDSDDAGVASVAIPLSELKDDTSYLKLTTDSHATSIASNAARLTVLETSWQWIVARGTSGSASASGSYIALNNGNTQGVASTYTISGGNLVEVPATGEYVIDFAATVKSTDTTNPLEFFFSLEVGAGNQLCVMRTTRRSGTAGDYVTAAGGTIAKITTAPSSNRIGLKVTAAGNIEAYDYVLKVRRIK